MTEPLETRIDLSNGSLSGPYVSESNRTLGQLKGFFEDEEARSRMPQDTVVYRVQVHAREKEGVSGGLFFGTSFLSPGLVGDEYFMTKGHFHAKRFCAEYYWCIQGDGILLLMDPDGNCRRERMLPGSLHYIPGDVAHRLVNVGDSTLSVGACWPSDAGHDYGSIAESGFSVRVKKIEGKPSLVGRGI